MIIMKKQFLYLSSIIALVAVSTISVSALEGIALVNDSILTNTSSNSSLNITGQGFSLENESIHADTAKEATLNNSMAINLILDNSGLNSSAKNLSTVEDGKFITVPISDIAKNSPEVAARSSSAQVSTELEEAYKLGSASGGLDPFNPPHAKVESLKLDMKTRSLRDTSKLFFVCDIV
jgi:hypothetical protein